jgi:hypothetical protein
MVTAELDEELALSYGPRIDLLAFSLALSFSFGQIAD